MTANAKSIKPAPSRLPTLEDVEKGVVTLDEYEIAHGEDIPEWTEEAFARARPVSDFPELAALFERARGQRGPQKAPIKDRVGLRLDHGVVEYFRATGPGWQSRINDVLADYVKQHGK
jgi:uncharacterized protein (DUF4415 family)